MTDEKKTPAPWENYEFDKSLIGEEIVWLERWGEWNIKVNRGPIVKIELYPPSCEEPDLWEYYKDLRCVTVVSHMGKEELVFTDKSLRGAYDDCKKVDYDPAYLDFMMEDEREGFATIERDDAGKYEMTKIPIPPE